MARYAVYWAPEPQHPLWRAGCEWLGRDAADPAFEPALRREHTGTPRRYGFHATLKAPFGLRDGASPSAFLGAVRACAVSTPGFEMPRLSVQWLHDFLALRPLDGVQSSHPLRRLADTCVCELDRWREVPSSAEQARREAQAGLSEGEREALRRHGYPYVLEHWRFHLTLSDRLPPAAGAERAALHAQACRHFEAALREPVECASISVFVEPAPGAMFELRERCALAPRGGTKDSSQRERGR